MRNKGWGVKKCEGFFNIRPQMRVDPERSAGNMRPQSLLTTLKELWL
jgi:hypothetical protein